MGGFWIMEISIGDKKIKGDGKWSFDLSTNQDKANIESLYNEHEATKAKHGQIWLNTNDNTYRIYDNYLEKWCKYNETNDPELKRLLHPFTFHIPK